MTKAYSYIRFSTPEQAKGDSKRRQVQQAEAYAAANGLELDDTLTYHDFGISAYRGANVEIGKLGEFMEAIRRKEVEAGSFLLVESLDRISRDQILPAQNIFTQIILEGVTIVTLADKRVYSAELVNKAPFLLIEAIVILIRANEESETKSKRLKAAWEHKRSHLAESAMTSIGPAWLKYNKDTCKFDVIPERAAIVLRMYKEHAKGIGCSAIAKGLRVDDIPTWTAKKNQMSIWRARYIYKILKNPAAIGTLVPHVMDKDERKKRIPLSEVKNYYPSVISKKLFDRVQTIRLNRIEHNTSTVLKNIFSLLGRCPLCGSRLMFVNCGMPYCYLACTSAKFNLGCTYKAIRYPRLEAAFMTEFVKALAVFPAEGLICNKPTEEKKPSSDFVVTGKEQFWLYDYLKLGLEIEKLKANRTTFDDAVPLDRIIEEYQKELKRLVSPPTGLESRQMDNLIDRFISAAKNKTIDPEQVNSILRLMCDHMLITSGWIEIQFKIGPKLWIKYDKKESRFTYNSAEGAYGVEDQSHPRRT